MQWAQKNMYIKCLFKIRIVCTCTRDSTFVINLCEIQTNIENSEATEKTTEKESNTK